jgi:hypothetical protein
MFYLKYPTGFRIAQIHIGHKLKFIFYSSTQTLSISMN